MEHSLYCAGIADGPSSAADGPRPNSPRKEFDMRKMLFGAVAGLICAGSALAQAPVVPVKPMAPAVPMAIPMAVPAKPMAPVAIPAAPAPVAPAVVAAPAGPGCGADCGTPSCAPACDPCAGKGGVAAKVFGHFKLGTATTPGCGCAAADRNFAFGSCNNFFNPGRTCSGMGLHGRSPCDLPTYAAPYGKPGNNCAGPFSYIDR
jgi:hypothetical protein